MVSPAMQLGYNDFVLLTSLVYSSLSIQSEWESFGTCRWPLHQWLLVSYFVVVAFRSMHLLGESQRGSADSTDFLLDLRQKGLFLKALVAFTWMVALPFFAAWTVVGSYWLWDSMGRNSDCPATQDTHLWFLLLWQGLSYLWIMIHCALGAVAWVMERRLRAAEGDLRGIEDDDLLQRWGNVSQLSNFSALSGAKAGAGLTLAELGDLPLTTVRLRGCGCEGAEADCEVEGEDCAVCLNAFKEGDSIRRLPGCSHTFHKSCIDLWLLRRADCPLCKGKVRSEERCGACTDRGAGTAAAARALVV